MSDYYISEAARHLGDELGLPVEFDATVLKALQVAQAEAFSDVVGYLERNGHRDAAKLLLDKVEAVWCRRTESVSSTSEARPVPARPTPAPPEPGPPATPPG